MGWSRTWRLHEYGLITSLVLSIWVMFGCKTERPTPAPVAQPRSAQSTEVTRASDATLPDQPATSDDTTGDASLGEGSGAPTWSIPAQRLSLPMDDWMAELEAVLHDSPGLPHDLRTVAVSGRLTVAMIASRHLMIAVVDDRGGLAARRIVPLGDGLTEAHLCGLSLEGARARWAWLLTRSGGSPLRPARVDLIDGAVHPLEQPAAQALAYASRGTCHAWRAGEGVWFAAVEEKGLTPTVLRYDSGDGALRGSVALAPGASVALAPAWSSATSAPTRRPVQSLVGVHVQGSKRQDERFRAWVLTASSTAGVAATPLMPDGPSNTSTLRGCVARRGETLGALTISPTKTKETSLPQGSVRWWPLLRDGSQLGAAEREASMPMRAWTEGVSALTLEGAPLMLTMLATSPIHRPHRVAALTALRDPEAIVAHRAPVREAETQAWTEGPTPSVVITTLMGEHAGWLRPMHASVEVSWVRLAP